MREVCSSPAYTARAPCALLKPSSVTLSPVQNEGGKSGLRHRLDAKKCLNHFFHCKLPFQTVLSPKVELYLYDRALKSEAVKSPSTDREPLKNRCRNVSKIIEKRRLASYYYYYYYYYYC